MIENVPFLDWLPFGIKISFFSVFLIIAFLSASYLIPRHLAEKGLDAKMADNGIIIAVFAAIIGAKIGYVFEVWDNIWVVDKGFFHTFGKVFFSWEGMASVFPGKAISLYRDALFTRGGLVFYGGLALVWVSLYSFMRYKGYEVWRYADNFMPALAQGYGWGRLGCLVSGDGCYGYGASVNIPLLTMVYEGAVPSAGVRVWNTPLIEASFSFLLFGFLMWKARKWTFKPGLLCAIFLIYNGVVRFSVEFLRINDAVWAMLPPPSYNGVPLVHDAPGAQPDAIFFEYWHWYGFTQSQLFALVIIAVGIGWIFISKLYTQDPNPAKVKKKK